MDKDEIALSFHDSLLRQSDLSIIRNKGWINDSIITFWFEYLDQVKYKDFAPRVAFISSEVAQLIKSADSYYSSTKSAVTSILQSMSLPEKELILIPVNDHSSRSLSAGGSHWTLISIIRNPNSQTFRFEHMDSLRSDSNQYPAHQIFNVLSEVLTFFPASVVMSECTPQTNSYDCGIHVMANADAVCQQVLLHEDTELTGIADMRTIRDLRRDLLLLIQELGSDSPPDCD